MWWRRLLPHFPQFSSQKTPYITNNNETHCNFIPKNPDKYFDKRIDLFFSRSLSISSSLSLVFVLARIGPQYFFSAIILIVQTRFGRVFEIRFHANSAFASNTVASPGIPAFSKWVKISMCVQIYTYPFIIIIITKINMYRKLCVSFMILLCRMLAFIPDLYVTFDNRSRLSPLSIVKQRKRERDAYLRLWLIHLCIRDGNDVFLVARENYAICI